MGLGISNSLSKGGFPQYRTRNSVTLDGNNGYITVTGHADFSVSGVSFSVSGWTKFTANASLGSSETGITLMDAVDGADPTNGFKIRYLDSSGDNEVLRAYHYHGGSSSSVTSTTNLVHNTWYHIVYTYNVLTTTGTLYLNGAVDCTPNTSMTTPDAFTVLGNLVEIGTASDGEADVITCEIGFWKGTCLSADQVAGIYNNGRPKNLLSVERDTLKGYWRLNAKDDTGSNNVIDSSGAGHHGTTGSDLVSGDFDTTDVPT